MAVIDDIEGLEVQILVDGVPLHEYEEPPDTNDDDETKVTRYVVAEPGKEFVVLIKGTDRFIHGPPEWDACAYIRIDGKRAKGTLMNRRYGTIGTKRVEGIDVDTGKGNWVRKCFMFSDLVFDNDLESATSKEQLKKTSALGEIQVDVVPGTIGRELDIHDSFGNDFTAVDKVHEKSLKGRAISHQTGLSAPKPSFAPTVSEFTTRSGGTTARFIFKYRSERDLKAEMIIPRSPTPVPLEDRPIDDLTPDELRELLRRKRAASTIKPEDRARVKRERTANNDGTIDNDSDDVEIVNPPPKRQRVIETVDLTGE